MNAAACEVGWGHQVTELRERDLHVQGRIRSLAKVAKGTLPVLGALRHCLWIAGSEESRKKCYWVEPVCVGEPFLFRLVALGIALLLV